MGETGSETLTDNEREASRRKGRVRVESSFEVIVIAVSILGRFRGGELGFPPPGNFIFPLEIVR